MTRRTNRRRFLGQAAAAGTGYWVAGSRILAESKSPNEKLNVAVVGAGTGSVGGIQNLPAVSGENVVAICDVDHKYAGPHLEKYPKARKWHDFRKMLDQQKDIDAVVISTPDHLHAVISVAAMKLGKHVYCEKPLARTIYEARVMREVAAKEMVATQMGNQGTGASTFRQAVEVLQSGALGAVRDVHAWTDRPLNFWEQGIHRPQETVPVPPHLKWDLWLGPAPERRYHPLYHPFRWRGWWDFGTCVLGDTVCHTANLAYMALALGYPSRVEVESEGHTSETGPKRAIIRYEFPARGDLPPVKLTWYENGRLPPRQLALGHQLPPNGSLIVGEKGALLTLNMYSTVWKLLPEGDFTGYRPPAPTLPRVGGHHAEWIRACKTGEPTMSNFDYAGKLTEAFLTGNVALRAGRKLEWNGKDMMAHGCHEADQYIRPTYRKGWSL